MTTANADESLDLTFGGTLRIPVIAAPMFLVSSPRMTLESCRSGVVGSFPAHSTRTREVLVEWLDEIDEGMAAMRSAGQAPAPYAVNLVVHSSNARYEGDLAVCKERRVEVVLTSKGAPEEAFQEIHRWGGIAFHDVASPRHAEKALEAGADGLIAVCGGAGGHTGTINPFALVSELRAMTDAPIIVAGGINHGRSILAAQAMGGDLAYVGTHLIAAEESRADDDYRDHLIACASKDVFLSAALDGAPANWLIPSLVRAGIDIDELAVTRPGEIVTSSGGKVSKRYNGVWSAGHGVGAITESRPLGAILEQLAAEYEAALGELDAKSRRTVSRRTA
ncbi:MAG: nitronate monooxygenase [Actinomycetota bacterium]